MKAELYKDKRVCILCKKEFGTDYKKGENVCYSCQMVSEHKKARFAKEALNEEGK